MSNQREVFIGHDGFVVVAYKDSQFKGTPGPWELKGETRLVGDPYKDGQHALYCAEIRHHAFVGPVCIIQSADHVGDIGISRENAQANARLIALAPEMLEALILCRPWMYEYASNTPDDAFDKLCAVMEKALGYRHD